MEMFHEADGLRCFSGYGVYAQDFIDQAEADPILCPEEVPQVCVIGNISIEIFGISCKTIWYIIVELYELMMQLFIKWCYLFFTGSLF